MRHIQLEDDLRLRFPGRTLDFDEGVEIGIMAGRMASGVPSASLWLAPSSLDQLRVLAQRLGYRVTVEHQGAEWVRATVQPAASRPKLKLVAIEA